MKPFVIGMRRAVLQAIGVALLVTCAIGFNLGDSPLKPIILLFLYSITAAIVWQVLFCDNTLSAFDRGFRRLALGVLIRYGLSVAVLACVAIWYGPVVMNAGYFRLFAPVVVSAMVCLLAPHYPISFGIVTVICIAASCTLESSREYSLDQGIRWSGVLSDPERSLFGSCLLFGMSLLASIPIHFHRKKV